MHTVDDTRGPAEKFLGDEDALRDRQRDNVRRLFGAGDGAARNLAALREEITRERGEAG